MQHVPIYGRESAEESRFWEETVIRLFSDSVSRTDVKTRLSGEEFIEILKAYASGSMIAADILLQYKRDWHKAAHKAQEE